MSRTPSRSKRSMPWMPDRSRLRSHSMYTRGRGSSRGTTHWNPASRTPSGRSRSGSRYSRYGDIEQGGMPYVVQEEQGCCTPMIIVLSVVCSLLVVLGLAVLLYTKPWETKQEPVQEIIHRPVVETINRPPRRREPSWEEPIHRYDPPRRKRSQAP